MDLAQILSSDLVSFVRGGTRDEVIEALVAHADAEGAVADRSAFRQAIFDREKIISTGIGVGVAIPHAKLSGQEDFFVCIGIMETPVDWDAIDKAPVRIVCMIGGPDNAQTTYLQILSQITEAIKDESRRRAILNAKVGEDVITLFTNKELNFGS